MKKLNLKNVSKDTWIRTILLAVSIINMVLTENGYGVLPIDEAELESIISQALVYGSAIVAWWKNNSFTDKAQEADKVCHS